MKTEIIYIKSKIRKGDTVSTIAGRDKGKTGKVLRVFPLRGRALVEGVNFTKKSVRKNRQDPQAGGIVQREAPIRISNLAIFCKSCNKPTRVGVSVLSDGAKSRFCKRCKELI